MLRYSEASGSSDTNARSFGVPQDDNLPLSRLTFHIPSSLIMHAEIPQHDKSASQSLRSRPPANRPQTFPPALVPAAAEHQRLRGIPAEKGEAFRPGSCADGP